jgi:serine/threonine protein kinase
MAPEAIRQKFSEKSDVWSYGIVVWEIVAGSLPHREVDRLELPLMIRDQGYHPVVPENCPPVLRKVMEACWIKEPSERPSFPDILQMLKTKSKEKEKSGDSESEESDSESSNSQES